MTLARWVEPPRRLLVLFLTITAAPLAALGWLSWRTIEQDRDLEEHRLQERQENAADLGVAALQRILAEIEGQLSTFSVQASQPENLASDVVLSVFDIGGLTKQGGAPLLYHPSLPGLPDPPQSLFSAGEVLEFQKQDYPGAIARFREVARATDSLVRAGALVRLARNCRKARDLQGALAAYEALAKLGATPVAGLPAELAARRGRASLFEEWKQKEQLALEAQLLDAGLRSGRWRLNRPSYTVLAEQVRRWLGAPGPPTAEGEALAIAGGLDSLWTGWRNDRLEPNRQGRRTLWMRDQPVLLVWRATSEQLAVAAMGRLFLEARWLRGLEAVQKNYGVQFALIEAEGRRVAGRLPTKTARQAVRTASAIGLPWTLHAVATPTSGAVLPGRRRYLLAGLILMASVLVAGSYFITRAISRELTVARMQSDFVAAVSHEFRSPLTTLRQLSELLLRGRVSSEDRRRQFYEMLVRESQRLQRLVEGLLDFKRMEAGAQRYRFEPVDPAGLVRSVVNEFQQEVAKDGYQVELQENGSLPAIRADQESLCRVLWNLLDNAVKYSPECRTVWVDLARQGKLLEVRVRDRGLGIPVAEQKEIFRKFARGGAAKTGGIGGTGLGLAMAQEIVEAHGGRITVESAAGQGSTFTVLLPVTES